MTRTQFLQHRFEKEKGPFFIEQNTLILGSVSGTKVKIYLRVNTMYRYTHLGSVKFSNAYLESRFSLMSLFVSSLSSEGQMVL